MRNGRRWFYNTCFHASGYCEFGAETNSEGIYLKDGMYKGIIPHFFRETLFRLLREKPWFRASLEVDGNTVEEWKRKMPDFVKELKTWIDEGRVEMVCGFHYMVYPFIISGESNVRQLQAGTEAIRRVLGVDVAFNYSQEITFHPQMPQLLKGMGFKGTVLRSHWPHYGDVPTVDAHRTLWEGLDGSKIDAVPTYKAFFEFLNSPLPSERARRRIKSAGINNPLITAVPDVGYSVPHWQWLRKGYEEILTPDLVSLSDKKAVAGLLKKQLDDGIRRLKNPPENGVIVEWYMTNPGWMKKNVIDRGYQMVTISEYFEATPEPDRTFKPDNDEFDYRHHFGAFGDIMTRKNKAAENKLRDAQLLNASSLLLGGPDFSPELDRASRLLLKAQYMINFCIPVTYVWRLADSPMRTLIHECDEVIGICEGVASKAIRHISQCTDTTSVVWSRSSGAVPIVVFNQLPWERTDLVNFEVFLPKGSPQAFSITDGELDVPCQVVETDAFREETPFRVRLAFVASNVPPTGHKVYQMRLGERDSQRRGHATAGLNVIENQNLRVRFNAGKGGCIESIFDKSDGTECIDTSSYYGNEFTGLFPEKGFRRSSQEGALMEVAESGPVRATMKVTGTLGGCAYTTLVSVCDKIERVDFETTFEFEVGTRIGDQKHLTKYESLKSTAGMWNQHDKLRVIFNPNLEGGHVSADMPFAVYQWRKNVIMGHNWADYSASGRGFALINTGNIGYYSEPERDVRLSMILAYGGPARGKGPFYLSGKTSFRYSIYPHSGDWRDGGTDRRSSEFNSPLIAVPSDFHKGEIKGGRSFVEINQAGVSLSSVTGRYTGENGVEFALRVFECRGVACTASLRFDAEVERARQVNLKGDSLGSLRVRKDSVECQLRPWEVKTIIVSIDGEAQ